MDAKTLCLAALQFGGASGYEIKKMFEEGLFSHIHESSFGSIYPALARLVAEGLAECQALAQEKRPDKKVYSITEKGRQALVQALMRPPAPDRCRSDFLVTLIFSPLLPLAHVQRLVEDRIAWHRAVVAMIEACRDEAASPGLRLIQGAGIAIHSAAADYLERHKHMLHEGGAEDPAAAAE